MLIFIVCYSCFECFWTLKYVAMVGNDFMFLGWSASVLRGGDDIAAFIRSRAR